MPPCRRAVDLVRAMIALISGQPFVGGGEIFGRVGAGAGALVDQPAGKAAARQLGIHIGPGAGDDVEAFFLGHRQQPVDVADAGEVVDALLRAVIAPVEIDGDGVVAARLHLLQDVAPQIGRGQAEGVHLARPDQRALAVDDQRIAVERDTAEGLACRRSQIGVGFACCAARGGERCASSAAMRRRAASWQMENRSQRPFLRAIAGLDLHQRRHMVPPSLHHRMAGQRIPLVVVRSSSTANSASVSSSRKIE